MALYSCILAFQSLASPGTQTVSGVVDAQTGISFTPEVLIPLGGYADVLNAVTNTDSRYHLDVGLHKVSAGAGGAKGTGSYQYNIFFPSPTYLKIDDSFDGTGYAFMDSAPFIFFGGLIYGTGYVSATASGSFDITWTAAARTSYRTVLVLGGTTWDLAVHPGISNTTYATASRARAALWFSGFNTYGTAKSAASGAGGTNMGLGFDVDGSNRGALSHFSQNQSTNARVQVFDRIDAQTDLAAITSGTPIVSAWGGTSGFTVSGASGALTALGLSFSGTDVRAKSGRFNVPAANGSFSVTLGINAKFVILMGVGAASSAAVRTDQASNCMGWTDGVSQHSFWTGESTSGNGSVLTGARYLSTTSLWQNATPNGASTAFVNVLTMTSLSSLGTLSLTLSGTDGTTPEVLWFAVGSAVAATGTTKILVADKTGVGPDDDEQFLSYVISRAQIVGKFLGQMGQVREPTLTGRETGATLQATLIKDFGLSTVSDTVVMTDTGETHTPQKFENLQEADIRVLQVKLGDPSPSATYWSLDKLSIGVDDEGESS